MRMGRFINLFFMTGVTKPILSRPFRGLFVCFLKNAGMRKPRGALRRPVGGAGHWHRGFLPDASGTHPERRLFFICCQIRCVCSGSRALCCATVGAPDSRGLPASPKCQHHRQTNSRKLEAGRRFRLQPPGALCLPCAFSESL